MDKRAAFKPSSKKASELEGCHILYVDDLDSNRFVVTSLLEYYSMICTSVANEHEALEATENEKFDIILMDLQLNNDDGYNITTKIREQPNGKNRKTPIIAFTAEPFSIELLEKVLAKGMQDLYNKPFEIETLLKKLAFFIKPLQEEEFSLDFYFEIFNYRKDKITQVKQLIIKDLKNFEQHLRSSYTKQETLEMGKEIHKVKAIFYNLKCRRIIDLLENYPLNSEKDFSRYNNQIKETLKIIYKKITETEV